MGLTNIRYSIRTGASMTRGDFLKNSFEAGVETTLAGNLIASTAKANGNVNVSFQINDKDTGSGLEDAIIRMVHNSNPDINFERKTDPTGYALIENVPTPVRHNRNVPTGYDLEQNYPNPFNPTTTFDFYTGQPGYVNLTIFNERGRHVKTLVSQDLPAGKHTVRWGGLNKFGIGTTAGRYFARLTAGKFTETIKLIKSDGGGTYISENVSTAQGESPPGLHKVLSPDLYNISVEKDGYQKIEKLEEIDQAEHFEWEMEKNKILKLYVIDNQTLEPTKGKVEFNSQTFETDENGYLEITVNSDTVNELKVYSTDNGTTNSFVQTYRDVPVGELPAGLMVTTYSNLTDVDSSLAVTPELFRAFMEEGNMGYAAAPAHGLRSIDFQNATNPVPNPDGEHGYVYWIDSDYAAGQIPSIHGTLTQEEQLYIKDVIEREIIPHIIDPTHKPQIYIAQPGEELPLKAGISAPLRPDDGIIFVTHRLGGNGYQFISRDYDNDGIINAATATVGDPTNLDAKISQEAGSAMGIFNPIYNPDMDGKTNFSERSVTGYLSPADLKVLAIGENVNKDAEWAEFTLPNQTQVMRGYYKPLTHINDILTVQ